MRWICLRGLTVLAAASLVLAAAIAVAEQPGAAVLDEPATGVPTPARHRPETDANVTIVTPRAHPAHSPSNPKSADGSLSPTTNPQEGPPAALVASSFKGVTPGSSTRADVAAAWGQPRKSAKSTAR